MTTEGKKDLVSLQERSVRKRRRVSDGHLRTTPLRRSCRVSEQSQERKKGDDDDTGETNESLLRKNLELLSKEDLIERVVRLSEVRNEFATLPDEIVVSIFKYLPQATLARTACVSKRWRRISYDPIFWKNVVINGLGRGQMKPGTLGQVLALGCQRLSVACYSYLKLERPIFTDRKPKKSYALKELTIQLDITPSELISILKRCSELVRIETSRIDFDNDVCEQIGTCPNVKEVRFDEDRDDVTYEGFLSLFTGCPRLEIFRPHYYLRNVPSRGFSADEVWSLIDVLPPAMQSISFFRFCLSLTDEQFRKKVFFILDVELLVTKVPNVVNLYLTECPLLTAKSVASISRLSQLRDLNINYCCKIPHVALNGLLKSCTSLSLLCVKGLVTLSQVSILREQFWKVTIVSEFAPNVSEDGLDDSPDDFEDDFDDMPDDVESLQSDDSLEW